MSGIIMLHFLAFKCGPSTSSIVMLDFCVVVDAVHRVVVYLLHVVGPQCVTHYLLYFCAVKDGSNMLCILLFHFSCHYVWPRLS
jgi:hypothetical protein